ncbi:MAG TPA: hypothetical protein VEF89_02865 [Solirubrobacteraceae bacterium]|nr:hypothetical protein [Solirubrobacteraceae bacterium]
MSNDTKTPADQVGEIAKLVEDAQNKLDQVTRALRSLEQRLSEDEPGRGRAGPGRPTG